MNTILSTISGSSVYNPPPDPKEQDEDDRYVLDDGESSYPCNYCEPIKSQNCGRCIGA